MLKAKLDLSYYRRLLKDDYGGYPVLQQAVILKEVHKLKSVQVEEVLGVKKDALRRACISMAKNREPGVSGGVSKLNYQEELILVGAIFDGMEQGRDMSYKVIQNLYENIWMELHSDNLQQGPPELGPKAIRRILDEYDLAMRTSRQLEPERKLTVETVSTFVNRYNEIVVEHLIPVCLRFNLDETWLNDLPDHHKSAGFKGGPRPVIVYPPAIAEHITLVPCVNGAGESFDTTAIVPLKTLPPLIDEVKEYFNITGSNDGWMNSLILKNVVEGIFVEQLQAYRQKKGLEGRAALLILDNHSSRVAVDEELLWREHKLIVLYIPPHSSALLQPLDLHPNVVFKQEYFKFKPNCDGLTKPEARNYELQAARLAMSSALSLGSVIRGWARCGLISKYKHENGTTIADLQTILKNKMVEWPYEPLPTVIGKRKLGPKFGTGGVWTNNENMVNLNPPKEKKPRKTKKNISAAEIVVIN